MTHEINNPIVMKPLFAIIALLVGTALHAQQLAFPGADGYGKYVTGGRGGAVYEVTNLKDDGLPGSLRYAINRSGSRTIIFRVSGNVELKSALEISNGDVTIAGQTAPGDGICIRNQTVGISANNVIIRYLRFRLGERWGEDALSGASPKNSGHSGSLPRENIMIDHCSVSYGCDETLSVYDVENLTVQWCIISESLNKEGHGLGAIMGGWGASLHHTLFAYHKNRCPRVCGARYQSVLERELFDVRYNVMYNAGKCYGGEGGHQNVINNYFRRHDREFCNPGRPDPNPHDDQFVTFGPDEYYAIISYWYIHGNYVEGFPEVNADNWHPDGVKVNSPAHTVRAYTPYESAYTGVEETAQEAFINVCHGAGATLPKRDAVDTRVVNDVLNNTGDQPNTIADVPGEAFPILNSISAPQDRDHDGMPDEWESANGLNPYDASDRNIISPNGYTMLEEYLNRIEFTNRVEGIDLKLTIDGHYPKMSWAECFLGEDGYLIERAAPGEDFAAIGTVEANANCYIDSTALPSIVYRYRVKAFNATEESSYSSEVSNVPGTEVEVMFTTPDPPAPPPNANQSTGPSPR